MVHYIRATIMTIPLLEVFGLSKTFGQYTVIKKLDFEIFPGEIVILTGPNGAGKTTLLQCVCGLQCPTSGKINIDGHDLYRDEVAAKQHLAFVPDVPRFYQELTTWEHLQFISLPFSVEEGWEQRAESLLKEFGLWENRDFYPHNLSRGMRLKLGIILALIRPFKILIMDEPTSAMDQESIGTFLEKLSAIKSSGGMILMSSHEVDSMKILGGKTWRMNQGQIEMD